MDEPLKAAQDLGRRRRRSALFFAVGVLCPPTALIAPALIIGPNWQGKSDVLDALLFPLLGLGAILCGAAPFLWPATTERRVLLAFAALFIFFVDVVVTVWYFLSYIRRFV